MSSKGDVGGDLGLLRRRVDGCKVCATADVRYVLQQVGQELTAHSAPRQMGAASPGLPLYLQVSGS